jgi:hypothetical protein
MPRREGWRCGDPSAGERYCPRQRGCRVARGSGGGTPAPRLMIGTVAWRATQGRCTPLHLLHQCPDRIAQEQADGRFLRLAIRRGRRLVTGLSDPRELVLTHDAETISLAIVHGAC